jgi:hypothetical protein
VDVAGVGRLSPDFQRLQPSAVQVEFTDDVVTVVRSSADKLVGGDENAVRMRDRIIHTL